MTTYPTGRTDSLEAGPRDQRRRGLTPARVVALVVMGLLLVGLLLLRFAGEDSVDVPVDAQAGDLPPGSPRAVHVPGV